MQSTFQLHSPVRDCFAACDNQHATDSQTANSLAKPAALRIQSVFALVKKETCLLFAPWQTAPSNETTADRLGQLRSGSC